MANFGYDLSFIYELNNRNTKNKKYRRLNYVYEKEIKNYNQLIYLKMRLNAFLDYIL